MKKATIVTIFEKKSQLFFMFLKGNKSIYAKGETKQEAYSNLQRARASFHRIMQSI